MKQITILLFFTALFISASAQKTGGATSKPDAAKKILLVDAACGICQLKLEGKECDLAVRIDGKAYYVDGTHIDEHGDAHADDGFCNSIRKAEVQGEIINNRFKASYFKLVKAEAKKD